jgi:hypothetical protein
MQYVAKAEKAVAAKKGSAGVWKLRFIKSKRIIDFYQKCFDNIEIAGR